MDIPAELFPTLVTGTRIDPYFLIVRARKGR